MARGRRGNGEGSIFYRDSENRWCGQVLVGYKADGSQNRKTIYGKTRTDVKNKILEVQNSLQNNTYIEPDKITLNQWLESWFITYKAPVLKPTAFHSIYSSYKQYIENSIGGIPLQQLSSLHIQNLLNTLIKKYVRSTVKKVYLVLSASLNKAVALDMLLKTPMRAVVLPKEQIAPKQATAFTIDQQKLFISMAKNNMLYYNLMRFAFCTGCRVGEILALTESDIDFKKKTISINKNTCVIKDHLGDQTYKRIIQDSAKTKSSNRLIPFLTDEVERIIKDQLELKKQLKLTFKDAYEDNNLLFPNMYGRLSAQTYLGRNFKKICRECDLEYNKINNNISDRNDPDFEVIFENLHFHMIRHTFATRCLEAGMNVKVVSKILGHCKIQITMDTYSHVLDKFQDNELTKISSYFKENNITF